MKYPRCCRWFFPVLLLWSGCDSAQVNLARVEKLKSEIEEKKKARSDLEKKIAEATDLETWILASMPIQPLAVSIIDSMKPESSIVHLQLERDAETPSQLRIRLVLNTESKEQLALTLEEIHKLKYREFNQTYTRSNGNLVYTARLLRENPPSEGSQTPKQTQKNSTNVPSISQTKVKGFDTGADKTRTEESELQLQLGLERELLTDLQQQSAQLLEFVGQWKPHFALVEDALATQTAIRMKVSEGGILTLSQRYEQVPHKVANKDSAPLPTLTRATLVFDDNHAKLLNWLGAMEKIKPTMRVGKLDLTNGSRGEDLRVELTLEVPLLRSGS